MKHLIQQLLHKLFPHRPKMTDWVYAAAANEKLLEESSVAKYYILAIDYIERED